MAMIPILAACSDSAGGAAPKVADGRDSTADAADLTLALAVTGTDATFVLRNTGSRPLVVLTRVTAGETHYDWFSIDVTGTAGPRRLQFVGDRDRAGTERTTLDPGQTWSGDADLAAWAARPVNGETALASGDHVLRATYQVSGRNDAWNGKIESPPVTVTW